MKDFYSATLTRRYTRNMSKNFPRPVRYGELVWFKSAIMHRTKSRIFKLGFYHQGMSECYSDSYVLKVLDIEDIENKKVRYYHFKKEYMSWNMALGVFQITTKTYN